MLKKIIKFFFLSSIVFIITTLKYWYMRVKLNILDNIDIAVCVIVFIISIIIITANIILKLKEKKLYKDNKGSY